MLPFNLSIQRETPGTPGGAPTSTQPPPAASQASPTAPASQPAGAPQSPPTAGQAAGQQQPDPGVRVKELEAELEKTRREAAGYRTGNKGQLAELHKALGTFLGQPAGDQPADAATILAQLQKRDTDREQELRRLKVDLALSDVYTKVGVKPTLTRALLEHSGVLSGLNPDEAEFSKALHAAVKKLADETPELKAGQAPAPTAPRSGGAFPGGNNAPPQLTRDDLKGMKPEEINAAREKGQLNQLLGRI